MARTLQGEVSSNKAHKTIIVTIHERKAHPLYHKQYTVSKKVMAHDEENKAKLGDRVVIAETKPLSARKRYRLERVVEVAAVRHHEPGTTKEVQE